MSAISSRPRVQSVSAAQLAAVAIGGLAGVAGIIASALRLFDIDGRSASAAVEDKNAITGQIQSVPALRRHLDLDQVNKVEPGLHATEAYKVATLRAIAGAPYLTDNVPVLRQEVDSFLQATSIEDARRDQRRLFEALETGHNSVLGQALALACSRAALRIGFGSIDTRRGLDGSLRVIATDPAGRALVSEIRTERGREPSVETEVLGIADASCNQILDAFDRALEEEGVRSSEPKRTFTGGVCELASAKEFIRKRLRRPTKQLAHVGPKQPDSSRRGHRLNNPVTRRERSSGGR
jgi:hypothetical protein